MAYENIEIQYDNFCIAPLVGTYATVDTSGTSSYLKIKNDTGVSTISYSFNPNIIQGTVIKGLEYVGVRQSNVLCDGMCFFTFESNNNNECTVKKWNLNTLNSRLDLDYTYTKTSTATDIYLSDSFTIGRYYTALTQTTVTGTGFLKLASTDTLVSGTRLYLGPSSNTSYVGDYEEVIVASVSGTTVFIEDATAPHSYYNSNDSVTYMGSTYITSDVGYESDTTKGTLFIVDSLTGEVLNRDYSAIYSNITALGYATNYYGTIGIVNKTELLYVDITNFQVSKSSRINNILAGETSYVDVLDIEFSNNAILRLQDKTVKRTDDGTKITVSWSSYNFQEDSFFRFSDTISMHTDPIGILANNETITIRCAVRDQYGVGISGKVVTFDKFGGDLGGVWGDINRQATTDVNGNCSITYTSGWYDPSVTDNSEIYLDITATVDGSNILTGSIYVVAKITIIIKPKYVINATEEPKGVALVVQKLDTKTCEILFKEIIQFSCEFAILCKPCFFMPGGDYECNGNPGSHISILRQWQNFTSKLEFYQEELLESELNFEQFELCNDVVAISQTHISRHLPTGNYDIVEIAQFKFMIDLIPKPFSEKNPVDTNIWVKLAPYGFDLNKSTLIFKIREVSYEGDTGYIDYVDTPHLTILEFDAGGGLIGLEILVDPPSYFHNNAIVYVYLELYDNAIPPNRIEYDYWFNIIPDYNAPYITNEFPKRNAEKVDILTNISFDIIDNEVGVALDTLELYINNRIKKFTYTITDNIYSILYDNISSFYYEQPVEISIRVQDSSGQSNVLYDMWRFTCDSSSAPKIDPASVLPKICSYGLNPRTVLVEYNVYETGDGINKDSITTIVNGLIVDTSLTPIIKRVK